MTSLSDDPHLTVPVTGSFGVTGCTITGDLLLEELVDKADAAMFMSKQAGRNMITVDTLLVSRTEAGL